MDLDTGGPKHADPADPVPDLDPQHCSMEMGRANFNLTKKFVGKDASLHIHKPLTNRAGAVHPFL